MIREPAMPSKHTDTELLRETLREANTKLAAAERVHVAHKRGMFVECDAVLAFQDAVTNYLAAFVAAGASPTPDHNPLTVKDMRHSDVVESVARAVNVRRFGHEGEDVPTDGLSRDIAIDALEACHHAELVEMLIEVGVYIDERADDSYSNREERLLVGIDAVLAKLGVAK